MSNKTNKYRQYLKEQDLHLTKYAIKKLKKELKIRKVGVK